MNIKEKRKIQQLKDKNTFIVVIPKIITYFLGLKRGDKLVFKNENDRVYIEKEG